MANAVRGQVSLKAGDTTYTLSLSANAICELEDATGKDISDIAEAFNKGSVSMKSIRSLVWAALQDQHHEIDLKGAGDVITAAGMARCVEAIGHAFKAAFPEAEGSGSRPPKAKAG